MARPQTLVADIGGTNTRVALATDGVVDTATIQRFANADHTGLGPVIAAYLKTHPANPIGACVAAAGPVHDNAARLTNLDWTIDSALLRDSTGAEHVAVLNDLQAQGHALGHISPDNLPPLMAGTSGSADTTSLVIGVGTGFNAAPVYDLPEGRLVAASECGHANLPIRTEADLRLSHFLDDAHGFPDIEEALSGRGIERIYAWLGQEAGDPRPLRSVEIMAGLNNASDPRAAEAAAVFARLLGTVTGNLALIHLPFGGIYLAGGMARAMVPYLSDGIFAAAFRDKGRFAGFMERFAISVIDDDYAALSGCAWHLENQMARG